LRDFLGSTFRKTLTAAISPTGATKWLAPTGTWSGLSNLSFEVNTTELKVNARNSTAQQVAATIPLNHNLLSRKTSGSDQLIKLRGDTARFNVAAVATSAAEGEQSTNQIVNSGGSIAPQSNNLSLVGEGEDSDIEVPLSIQREGESEGQPVLTVSRTAPAAQLTPSEALRALLGSSKKSSALTAPTLNIDSSEIGQEITPSALSIPQFEDELLDLLASDVVGRADG